MYYPHFGLKEPPFKITPNTDFFFSGGNRGAVLDALIYAIVNGEGIIKVVGEVGSGKTMLCRMLQTILPEKVESIYLANPSVAPEDVLDAIAFELQLKIPKNADRLKVMQILQAHLLKRHAEGRQVVIFVEEAQGMPLATLEEIRLLSNLETKQDKLLQIVLFGQPELDVNLNETHIRQLRERITHSFHLGPLQTKDIAEYLIFRLRAAGYHGPHLFTDSAIKKLSSAAEGLVRRVNILADKALLAAFAENAFQVTPKHVKAAIQDSEFGAKSAKNKKFWLLAMLLTLLSTVAIYSWYAAWYAPQKTIKTTPIILQPQIKAKPVAEKSATTPTVIENKPLEQPSTSKQVIATEVTTPATPIEAPKTSSPPQPVTSAQNAAPQKTAPTQAIVEQIKPKIEKKTEENPSVVLNQSSLDGRLEISKNWLFSEPSETITLQIKSLRSGDALSEEQLKEEFNQTKRQLEIDKVYLYRKKQNGQDYTVILYGAFKEREEALAALKKLPASIKNNKPYLRTLAGINKEIEEGQ